eukprot:1291803-Pyramimonas_sp.AAC.1
MPCEASSLPVQAAPRKLPTSDLELGSDTATPRTKTVTSGIRPQCAGPELQLRASLLVALISRALIGRRTSRAPGDRNPPLRAQFCFRLLLPPPLPEEIYPALALGTRRSAGRPTLTPTGVPTRTLLLRLTLYSSSAKETCVEALRLAGAQLSGAAIG